MPPNQNSFHSFDDRQYYIHRSPHSKVKPNQQQAPDLRDYPHEQYIHSSCQTNYYLNTPRIVEQEEEEERSYDEPVTAIGSGSTTTAAPEYDGDAAKTLKSTGRSDGDMSCATSTKQLTPQSCGDFSRRHHQGGDATASPLTMMSPTGGPLGLQGVGGGSAVEVAIGRRREGVAGHQMKDSDGVGSSSTAICRAYQSKAWALARAIAAADATGGRHRSVSPSTRCCDHDDSATQAAARESNNNYLQGASSISAGTAGTALWGDPCTSPVVTRQQDYRRQPPRPGPAEEELVHTCMRYGGQISELPQHPMCASLTPWKSPSPPLAPVISRERRIIRRKGRNDNCLCSLEEIFSTLFWTGSQRI
eukprot:GHVU01152658.1.p1 GENE.GHVU01152658.1~~GHVU01152658.1.p1  ORF type:complete len:417 (+),score=29.84 GHVU01152658.1:166-1251(+)